ncbi:hypothetical protein [Defluviitalea saccharophila]|uniref:Uncharacterized protein n=1 Tax=Defluviitalea saccharophila TaxID=879970 RepID=A0ABZ2Y5I6_9FIRM
MRNTEFSKILAIAVSILFFASIIFVFAVWYFEDRLGTEILAYVSAPFGVVITGYFAKAGVENYSKINHSRQYEKEYEDYRGVEEEWVIRQ